MEAPRIPIQRTPTDALREGNTSLRVAALAPHPMQVAQANGLRDEWEARLWTVERVYGAAAAWQLRMDRAALSTTARLPGGPPSSHVGLDALLGRDTRIGFEDVLNLPELRPRMSMQGPHELAARAVGLQ